MQALEEYTAASTDLLYHYTTREIALEKILYLKCLRFSKVGSFDDPRERLEKSFVIVKSIDERNTDTFHLEAIVNRAIKQNTNALCLCADNDKKLSSYPEDTHYRGYAKARMWSQHGQFHEGICLAISKTALAAYLKENFSEGYLAFDKEVVYENMSGEYIGAGVLESTPDNPDEDETYIEGYIRKHYRALFFQKVEDYADECEYRFIIYHSNEQVIEIPLGGIIRATILGVSFPLALVPSARFLCTRLKCPLYQMNWTYGIPSLLSLDPNEGG